MIYITGDCHSDFRRFTTDIFPEQKEMSKDDYVIILGDFGGVWYRDCDEKHRRKEEYWLDWLESKTFTTLFIDGNHENFNRLYSYPIEGWHGGKVHKIRSSVLHLMRGEVFEIDGKRIFAFGGASSHDIEDGILKMDEEGEWKTTAKQWDKEGKMYRVKDLTWWEQELPSDDEIENGLDNLKKCDNEVDFVITHCAPQQVVAVFSHGFYKQDRLTEYFNSIAENNKYTRWFFGHYHDNMQILEKYIMLYEQIIRIS